MIDLDQKYLRELLAILNEKVPDYDVWVFGSRVSGTAQQFSDLDLVLVGKERMDWRRLQELKDALSESDLPIMVDVLDWHDLSESFRSIITRNHEVIQVANDSAARSSS